MDFGDNLGYSTVKPQEFYVDGKTLFASCVVNPHCPEVNDISPGELRQKLTQVCVIDVRGSDEFHGELGHIPGARLITLDELPDRVDEIPRQQTVVFVCHRGGRSARASAWALEQGFTNVLNLTGGMTLWNQLGYEVEK